MAGFYIKATLMFNDLNRFCAKSLIKNLIFCAAVCLIFSFNPDPRAYHTVWGCVIGITFSVLVTWTVSQPTAQRALAARTLRDAKM